MTTATQYETQVARTLPEFRNEALTDFTRPENKSAMEAALKKVKDEFGREHPLERAGLSERF